jgi:hypothetical protein
MDNCLQCAVRGEARNLLTEKMKNVSGILLTSYSIEEGRAASKSPHETFGYFIFTSQQEVSADNIKIHLVETSSPKQKEQRQKQLDVSFF